MVSRVIVRLLPSMPNAFIPGIRRKKSSATRVALVLATTPLIYRGFRKAPHPPTWAGFGPLTLRACDEEWGRSLDSVPSAQVVDKPEESADATDAAEQAWSRIEHAMQKMLAEQVGQIGVLTDAVQQQIGVWQAALAHLQQEQFQSHRKSTMFAEDTPHRESYPSGTSDVDPSTRMQVAAQAMTAYRDDVGWRVPLVAQLFQPDEGKYGKRMALCRVLLLRAFYGIHDFDEDALKIYEERARMVFRSLEFSNTRRGKHLEVRLVGAKERGDAAALAKWHALPASDVAGRSQACLWFSDAEVQRALDAGAQGGKDAVMEVRLADTPSAPSARVEVRFAEEQGVTVVSDIDDTVKITEVFRGHQAMLRNTFLRRFMPVSGMPELYRTLHRNYAADFQYVSKSPPELHEPLREFLGREGFPKASLHLCPIWAPNRATFKKDRVEALLREFPHRSFILVGDSGEHDAAIYAQVLRKYPDRIRKILIREVDPACPVDIKRVFAGIARQKWQVFRDPAEVDVSSDVKLDTHTAEEEDWFAATQWMSELLNAPLAVASA